MISILDLLLSADIHDVHFDPAVLMGVYQGIRANLSVHGIAISRTRYQGLSNRDDVGYAKCLEHCRIASVLPRYEYMQYHET
jgi:hypothetical protein